MASILNALEALHKTGGFTYSITTGELNPTRGFIVAVDKAKEKIVTNAIRYKKTAIVQEVKSYISSHIDDLNQKEFFLGAWMEKGNLYLDIVERYTSRRIAEAMCIKRDQLAYFDCALGEAILLNK